jgi:hypothetical protein
LFESRVLEKIFVPKMGQVTSDWRELNNGEVHGMESPQVIWAITLDEGEVSGVFVMHGKQEKCV